MRGFLVKDKGSAEKFVSFDELYVNLQSISALKFALVLREIRLKQPYINIKRIDETTYNFSDLMENKEAKPAEKPAEKSKPLRFSLNNIKIENGSIDFWDGPETDEAYDQGSEYRDSLPIQHPTHISIFLSNLPCLPKSMEPPMAFRGRPNLSPIPVKPT